MNDLANDPLAFIRPSPSGDTLGGVARRTRESLLLCEAFGFDYVLVETVGVGQSETTVAQMVDLFMMLLQPGAGDDLQGIKRGILEMVDMVVVTKDDGDNQKTIQKAKHDYEQALHILRQEDWVPPVLTCSSVTKKGLPEVQSTIDRYFHEQQLLIEHKRTRQGLDWMWQLIHEGLKDSFLKSLPAQDLKNVTDEILKHQLAAPEAADYLLKRYFTRQGEAP